jgi:hypothetical protein
MRSTVTVNISVEKVSVVAGSDVNICQTPDNRAAVSSCGGQEPEPEPWNLSLTMDLRGRIA